MERWVLIGIVVRRPKNVMSVKVTVTRMMNVLVGLFVVEKTARKIILIKGVNGIKEQIAVQVIFFTIMISSHQIYITFKYSDVK